MIGILKFYKDKYGIIADNLNDVDIIQWWKWIYYGTPNGTKLKYIPDIFYNNPQDIKKLCRFVIENEMRLTSREEISQITTKLMSEYKISFFNVDYIKFSPYNLLQFCYPEYQYKNYELKHVPNNYWKCENNRYEYIEYIINKYMCSLEDILNGNIDKEIYKKLNSIINMYYKSMTNLWIWYFSKKGIDLKHEDFKSTSYGYYNKESHIINKIKNYCEQKCKDPIINLIENRNVDGLRTWIKKYFNHDSLKENNLWFRSYSKQSFHLLTLAYPEIIKYNLLFNWDVTNCKKWDDMDYRIKSLRELVIYRLKITSMAEIPKVLTRSNLYVLGYTKFTSIKDKYYKDSCNFYEWACEAFPEYGEAWNKDDFGGVFVAFDGAKCNSNQERMLYEFIKINIASNIKSIGTKRTGKYIFQLPENHNDEIYCPDFVIETDNKPIIIEYYGMYDYSNKFEFAVEYNAKTQRKNDFFKSQESIVFVDIYPCDLKNNFANVVNKLNNITHIRSNCA